jgi:hypothetical protein
MGEGSNWGKPGGHQPSSQGRADSRVGVDWGDTWAHRSHALCKLSFKEVRPDYGGEEAKSHKENRRGQGREAHR